jgi:hypothetical protein
MSMLPQHTRLYSLASNTTEIQIVSTSRDVIIDTQVEGHDVTGTRRRQHATARLSLDDAVKLEMLLGDAITAALGMPDTRPTRLWSNSAAAAVIPERRISG